MKPIVIKDRSLDGYIFLMGCKYYRAAHYIPESDRGAPYYTNLSFAIELFIKCFDVTTERHFKPEPPYPLIKWEQKIHARTRGHSLLEMFKRLPEPLKTKINIQYCDLYGLTFVDELGCIENVFVEWRYVFEKQEATLSLTSLERAADFLKEFIEQHMLSTT
ncbi:hypothetical protein MTR11_20245 [Vibrio sp. CCB-PB317]|uniref:hypothetical protein n=1 Tax=Vibrio sp. CCB-PB317 TaxID=2929171 RepID=UPI001FAE5118|nr:hypothetical protein [Vibrio sp. CCB-PB317]MCJ0884013.1 hypothetical protein [Vibrio sp. CCB-PB317]